MSEQNENQKGINRRQMLKRLGIGGAAAAVAATGGTALATMDAAQGKVSFEDQVGTFFQKHYTKMTRAEVQEALERLERTYKAKYDVDVTVEDYKPIPGVLFGYALNISKCQGYRECVKACTMVNNQSREPEIQYIRVLEMDHGSMNLEESEHYFPEDEQVPRKGKWYLPVQCHQCENPPCVKACPVVATWKEADGIVVVDYNWCIGCRMCANACPYWARKFNWQEPVIPQEDLNPKTHYLSNRPRMKGVMEKCTFCLQRTRKGELPACMEACPTGARVFGNLLDPASEIRYVLENKNIFRLKEDLNTNPKFWYYSD